MGCLALRLAGESHLAPRDESASGRLFLGFLQSLGRREEPERDVAPIKLLTTPGRETISLGVARGTETGLNEHRKGQEERGKGGEMLNLWKQERIDTAGGKHLPVSCVKRGNTRWRPSGADKCTHIVTVSLFFVLRWVCLPSLPSGATENRALLHPVSGEEHTETH